ncbi:acyl-CoA dehydrogenase family protein [Zooshikella marina]|uniref:acyl-CoA dehydrogenase family protein n=1 Tax=Zooshikella ganghwensis TaxID=202772 RepID=UPI001BAE5EC3|nr:acyl-CoA dehydrogenase family protein [Zooshikella ganghwensis]MBU2708335.1 acyl-CoA dehydrogenase family protein [Zooshikella ganghwensis]
MSSQISDVSTKTEIISQECELSGYRRYAETHNVINQPLPLENYNAYSSDPILGHWFRTFSQSLAKANHAFDSNEKKCWEYGKCVGHELQSAGFLANKYIPEFLSHDRYGHRIDQVNYHPAYHQLMATAIKHGHHCLPWQSNYANAHLIRAAIAYLHTQADPGSGCPLTMTFAAVPTLKKQPNIAAEWLPKVYAQHYDPDNKPFFMKKGVTIGMAMTEKQGGSDVRANTTTAKPLSKRGPGEPYDIVGHKWFCSAPMSDAFLVLAQSKGGLSCFLMPRWCPEGEKNQFFIQRLKNKMGNLSNASSEVEFRGALAWMIGEEGRGVNTIIDMVSLTRFDCIMGSSALMRQGVAQAIHYARQRKAFGKLLVEQPLMSNVLADLVVESEASLALGMRLAFALDQPEDTEQQMFIRLVTALGKYWVCKRAVQHTYEAMECVGGMGVVEETVMPRLYREAPVNAIWEGSGNIQCLDILRAMNKQPEVLDVFMQTLSQAKGSDLRFDKLLTKLKTQFKDVQHAEFSARRIVEQMAILLQASLLLQYGNSDVADAFFNSRLTEASHQYGTLPYGVNAKGIIDSAVSL